MNLRSRQDLAPSWLSLGSVVAVVGIAPVVWDPVGAQAFLHAKLLVLAVGVVLSGLAITRAGVWLPDNRLILAALSGLLLIAILATITADAPFVALLGSGVRQLGLTVWVVHGLLALAAMSMFRGRPQDGLRTAAYAMSGGLVVASVLAILESLDATPFDFSQTFDGRVQSVMGNPAALGAYLVLGLPLVAAVALDASGSRWSRGVAGGAVLLAVPSLILTGSRGAWLGGGAAIAVAAIAWFRPARRPRWIGAVASALVIVAVLATLPSGRWQTLGEAGEGRLDLWRVGVEASIANPVLGVGPDGFGFEFGGHVTEEFVVKYSREQVYDRAHNGVVDAAVVFGLPGVGLYLVLIAGVLVVAYRVLRSEDPVYIGVGAGLVGYLVQQQTYFQVSVIDAVFWFLVGMGAAAVIRHRNAGAFGRPIRFAVVGLGLVLVGYAVLGIQADHLDRKALATSNPYVAINALESAALIRPFDNVHYIEAASIAREVSDVGLVQDVLDLVRSGRERSPSDELMILAEVNLLNQLFRLTGDLAKLDEGDRLLTALVERDPTNGEAYLRLGTSAYYRGNAPEAESSWLRAETLLPNSSAPRANLEVLYAELGQ